MNRKWWERWGLIVFGATLLLVLLAAIAFFAYRDGRAKDRCEALGGQTWDSGQHCAIGVDYVVDTHNRTWG